MGAGGVVQAALASPSKEITEAIKRAEERKAGRG